MRLKELLEEVDQTEADELRRRSGGTIHVNANNAYWARYDLSISMESRPQLFDLMVEKTPQGNRLRHQLELVDGNFTVGDVGLYTFENFPIDVKGVLDAWGNEFSSLEGITPYIGKKLELTNCDKLTSFAGIGKYVKKCPIIIVPGVLKSNILGVMMIPNLARVETSFDEISPEQCPELSAAMGIINENLLTGSRDIMDVKEDMMTFAQYNLKPFAKL